MTKSETRSILALIAQAWRNAPDADEATLSIWSEMLADMPLQLAKLSVKKLLLTGKPFSPSIAEVRSTALDITQTANNTRLPTPAEAYGQAREASATFVEYSDGFECSGMEKMHPLARKALELFGVSAFFFADAEVKRAQYMRMYEQLLHRAEEDMALPLSFEDEVRSLGQSALGEQAKELIQELAAGKGI